MKPTLNESQVSWNKDSRCKKRPGPINEGNFTIAVWKKVFFFLKLEIIINALEVQVKMDS